ncbi:hypothetical protein KEM52_001852, partial [Ascosphaera acerosa]
MESAPLTKAHVHARNAQAETAKHDLAAAGEEHRLAAEEYEAALAGCRDPQALRTLRLLEQHHKRLAELLDFRRQHAAAGPPGVVPAMQTLPGQSREPHHTPTHNGSAGGSPSCESPVAVGDPALDDPFDRFYATFGGIISKISAPLAFAGLPL